MVTAPLKDHWSNACNYDSAWSSRSKFVAQLLRPDERWVCDLGCGMQTIRSLLPGEKKYLPADLKKWTSDTELCDLEAGIAPLRYITASDVCLLLGVLEYVTNTARALSNLSPFIDRILLTYSTREAYTERDPLWVNNYTESELIEMLVEAGYQIRARHFIPEFNQVLIDASGRRRRKQISGRVALARLSILLEGLMRKFALTLSEKPASDQSLKQKTKKDRA